MDLRFTALTSPELISQFCGLYTLASGTPLDPAHLGDTTLFALFGDGRMLGGYVLRTGGVFRAISAIEDERARIALSQRARSAAEITGLWLSPTAPRLRARSLIVRSILRETRERRIMGITTKPALWARTYVPMGARPVYRGPTQLPGKASREGVVFEVDPSTVRRRLPLYLVRRWLPSPLASWRRLLSRPCL